MLHSLLVRTVLVQEECVVSWGPRALRACITECHTDLGVRPSPAAQSLASGGRLTPAPGSPNDKETMTVASWRGLSSGLHEELTRKFPQSRAVTVATAVHGPSLLTILGQVQFGEHSKSRIRALKKKMENFNEYITDV